MENLPYTLTDIEAANAPNTDPAKTYVRPLGSFEHLFWLLDQASPRHFSLAAQIEGSTIVGDWRVALDHVQRRHPFFSVCIEKDRNSNPQFRQVLDKPIPLRSVRVTSAIHAIQQAVSKGLGVEAAMQLAAHGFAYEAMVSNLGNLRYETSFGEFKLKALWGPAIGGSFEGGRTIGVVTVNETLHLLHTSYAPVPFLLERIEKVLLAACEMAERS
jgi:hypothetical protein